MTQEQLRLQQPEKGKTKWKKWGPYVSDRQWGTVREDYSADGQAWEYLSIIWLAARHTDGERYHDLEKANLEFLQRFPQHIIASYLGINRETLSRIRSRGVKK